jgi:hypothetical protein
MFRIAIAVAGFVTLHLFLLGRLRESLRLDLRYLVTTLRLPDYHLSLGLDLLAAILLSTAMAVAARVHLSRILIEAVGVALSCIVIIAYPVLVLAGRLPGISVRYPAQVAIAATIICTVLLASTAASRLVARRPPADGL